MKIGIYNPYLDTLGGHERYCIDLASGLTSEHQVDIFWDDKSVLDAAQARFRISTAGMRVVKNIWKNGSFLTKMRVSRQYDAIFFVSDGSIPWMFSKKRFLLFEFPLPWVSGKNLSTQLKLKRATRIICNSPFVKQHIDVTFGVNSSVLLPGIDVDSFQSGKKEQLILSVGRFTTGMNTKKQDVLIEAFKSLCDQGLVDWKLVLTGGMLEGDLKFVEKLKSKAKGYPIEIIPNISFKNLQSLYGRARIYWHAAGFGEDLTRYPERAEHFGISTIEAMSAAVVPVVFAGGGQKDIVERGVNGFLWTSLDELIEQTRTIIADKTIWSLVSKAARKHAQNFSRERFHREIKELL
jgi:glycosyltransferase involved in cell wall biosynthesis